MLTTYANDSKGTLFLIFDREEEEEEEVFS